MKLITDILRDFRKGRAVDQASRMLAEVVRAVDETGKPGEVSITVKVKPDKDGEGNMKTISIKCAAKRPYPDLPEGVFFSDAEGDLHRHDPAQREMFSEAESGDEGSGATPFRRPANA